MLELDCTQDLMEEVVHLMVHPVDIIQLHMVQLGDLLATMVGTHGTLIHGWTIGTAFTKICGPYTTGVEIGIGN